MRDQNTLQENTGIGYRILTAPWIWAVGATWVFYQQIPNLPFGKELALRYFCGHPLERVLAGLFFVGLSIIAVKAVIHLFELRAFYSVPNFGIREVSDDLEQNVAGLQSRLTSASSQLQNTFWGRRLDHILVFYKGKRSGQGVGEHLTYLSEAAADKLHASHALLQTVIWSIPILGFLGTVMGITLAIANVTPDQLETSLDEVTNGLAVAFDTTALALSLSLILGFASLFIKRAEEDLLSEIDERCRLEVNRCFPQASENSHSFLDAESEASQTLLEQTVSMIGKQTETWSIALEELRKQWAETLATQQEKLAEALTQGTGQTLTSHAEQLSDYRQQFIESQESLSLQVFKEMQALAQSRESSEREMYSSIRTLSETLSSNVEASSQEQLEKMNQLLSSFAERIESWQSGLSQLSVALIDQSENMVKQGEQLEKILGKEESLIRLQSQLDNNLDTLHTAETFEQTLHNLTAAVNLLTARSRTRDAA